MSETPRLPTDDPGYLLWAAMNDAEAHDPPLDEGAFWRYAAGQFLAALAASTGEQVPTITRAQYIATLAKITAVIRLMPKRSEVDALRAALEVAESGHTPSGAPETGGPEDGHTFDVIVAVRGSGGLEGGPKADANWWGPPWAVKVRAWNLQDAVAAAATIPLPEWHQPSEDGS